MAVAVDAALSGLRAAQRALDITSVNISNAATEGYTRKILPQESLIIAGKSVGTKTGAAFRNVDQGLLTAQQDQRGLTGYFDVQNNYLSRLMDFHGPSEAGVSISSRVGDLSNSFNTLSSEPNNLDYLTRVISEAQQTTITFNNFSNLINDMRQQTENDITTAVNNINQELESIAKLNQQITKFHNAGRSTADLEDQRDMAIGEISKYIDINTYLEGQDLIVITKRGHTLADNAAHPLYFGTSSVSSSKYYPDGGLNGIRLESITGKDITDVNMGGELGALFNLRDETLPTYEAQLDELAQKLAYRLQQSGLSLFTDPTGNIPGNVAPPGAVGYVGFARQITVNPQVIADPNLLRHGTIGNIEEDGSIEVIRRVVQFAFGNYQYEEGRGNVDISGGVLIGTLGMVTNNRITGTENIAALAPDFSTIPNVGDLPGDFDISLGGLGGNTITVLATDDAASLVNKINVAFGATIASTNSVGQLALNHNGIITLADNTIGAAAFSDLGMTFAINLSPEPSFTIKSGVRNTTTISIAPADTSVELLAKLNAVQGISAVLTGGGELLITPSEGGDITLVNLVGQPLQDMGIVINNIAHTAMRSDNLGPNGDLSTGLLTNSNLTGFGTSIISSQGETARIIENRLEQETTFLNTLTKRNSNTSGVNIDEEMASLIRLQSAYSAAAKMIATTNQLFEKLLNNT